MSEPRQKAFRRSWCARRCAVPFGVDAVGTRDKMADVRRAADFDQLAARFQLVATVRKSIGSRARAAPKRRPIPTGS